MRSVTFHIKRYDPARDEKGSSRVQAYEIPYETSLTVLEGLFYIQEELDGSLAFRYCCRASICGSCAMYINGRYRLACQTNVLHLHTDEVHIEPLPHMPLVKDLVCDMDDFFAKYAYIEPWLIRHSQEPAKEILQSPADRHKLNMPIDCILCGACYSSCPSVWSRGQLPGPGGAAQGVPVRGRLPRRGQEGTPAQVGQRARRLPLPHHHQLHRGVPEGAEPDGGHPVAQDGGRAPQAVRPRQVTRGGT